ncbi:MAG: TIGR03435 family protein [Candidatus Sulfopaludibacter sp.]|nr:TIGR03435 family protein [Candidatus Sulfopaludibacter sp.]
MHRVRHAFIGRGIRSTGQPAENFEAADVRASPHSENSFNLFMRGPQTRAGRYEIKTATMVDLISAAYGVDPDKVYGGPNWLEMDRFDITAKLPAAPDSRKVTPDRQKTTLQALLAERFHLVAHTDDRPMPAYLMTAGKHPQLKDADPAAQPGCQGKPRPQGAAPTAPIEVACHGMSAAEIAENLHEMAGGYLRQPVVDSTGLKGTYDFDLKWTGRGQLAAAGADGISIFDAVDKQLGLKLELAKAPLPVVVVESVDQKPTENAPDIATILPGVAAPTEFEVAEVKLTPPEVHDQRFQIQPGGRIDIEGFDLKFVIEQLWQLSDDMIVGAPKWLSEEKISIIAKAPAAALVNGQNGPPIDIDALIVMIKNLLVERFKLQTHMEERPINAYTLVAVKPKMKPADPSGRIKCAEGPGTDQKDPRDSHPILGRLLNCRNMTMARFASMLQGLAPGYIHSPVLDNTGLAGSWDFTLNFSSAGQFQGRTPEGAAPPPDNANVASDPNGALSLSDAVSRELGLKLEQTRRPVSVLVIDHIEPKPTDN